MKKKIGELYNKPIVIGNSNEFTKDEIDYKELKQGNKKDSEITYRCFKGSMFFEDLPSLANLAYVDTIYWNNEDYDIAVSPISCILGDIQDYMDGDTSGRIKGLIYKEPLIWKGDDGDVTEYDDEGQKNNCINYFLSKGFTECTLEELQSSFGISL